MKKKVLRENGEQFKTMIGGQALIEGILMRGPKKDAIVIQGRDGQQIRIQDRVQRDAKSWLTRPFIRGVCNFWDAQVTGVKALLESADLSGEGEEEDASSKLELWLEQKLGNETVQKILIGTGVVLGIGLSVLLFFLLPMVVSSFFDRWIPNVFLLHLLEGLVRIAIFVCYIMLVSRMKEMKRVFAYHGAEHKTIRCYEAGLPLTVDNVRKQIRLHPRCGTSFLLVVMVLSILIFSVASSLLLAALPGLKAMQGSFLFRVSMIGFKLLLLPVLVSIGYEINRWVGRHDNPITRMLTAPGMWFQKFTTNEPDDSMIEVGIAVLQAVIPEEMGADRW